MNTFNDSFANYVALLKENVALKRETAVLTRQRDQIEMWWHNAVAHYLEMTIKYEHSDSFTERGLRNHKAKAKILRRKFEKDFHY